MHLQTHRKTDRQRVGHTKGWAYRGLDIHANIQTESAHTERMTYRHTNRVALQKIDRRKHKTAAFTDRHIDRESAIKIDEPTEGQTETLAEKNSFQQKVFFI